MTDTIKKIHDTASALGACTRMVEASDWRSLARLLFSPQGREFCEWNNFPDISLWGEIKRHCDTAKLGIFIDAGKIRVAGNENIALIGKTDAVLEFDKPSKAHRVILMHGAKATVKATNYAVVLVVKISPECEVKIDKDETSTILW